MENVPTPVVVILGHVNHGKTTLLDSLRATRYAEKEAGGITQRIGASQIITKEGKKITFIDTPGHAAFAKMRGRGTSVADLAILVVAGDDSVQPQTRESIAFIREAGIPFIVAITKIDLPSADIEKVKGDLEKEGIFFEGRGGDTVVIPISSKKGQGLDELLEMIILVSEMKGLSGSPQGDLEAVVIETSKDKRGLLVSVVVKDGILKSQEVIYSADKKIKIKGLVDTYLKRVSEILPGEAGQILGFDFLPEVGSLIKSHEFSEKLDAEAINKGIFLPEGKVPLFLKANNLGSLEAVMGQIPAHTHVISSGVGEITENDIFLAKSQNSLIVTFGLRTSKGVIKLAEKEKVKVENFEVIYDLIDFLDNLLVKEEILGKAEIIAVFPYDGKQVAGCRLLEGRLAKGESVRVCRGSQILGEAKIISLKKRKEEIKEIADKEEFGVFFEPQLDFRIGDMLLSLRK